MKQVCIIGHFANGQNFLNGQTVKTKIVKKEIIREFGEGQVSCVDTHGGIKALKKILGHCFCALKCHKNIVILPAENGLRFFAPVLVLINVFFHRRIHYVVIGGWLPQFLQNKRLLSYFLKRFDTIYVEANAMKTALLKRGFDNIVVVPNCKELTILQPDELVIDVSEPFKLCTFSRVMREKGIEEAVRAVKTINDREKKTVFTLDIYGQIDSRQTEWFQTLQESFPVYIRYKGTVPFDRSTEVLKNYYALLFPTFYEGEGFAGTLIDAMAAGVPVIASNWKYNSEIVKNWENGLLFENSLEETLYLSLLYKEKWTEMKRLCIEKAKSYLPAVALKPVIDRLI